jgi:hypothetical protein
MKFLKDDKIVIHLDDSMTDEIGLLRLKIHGMNVTLRKTCD